MLSLPLPVRVFLATRPADMRRSFDGLAMLVRESLGEDPFSGHLFVFCNRRGDRVKLLCWERGGFCIWYKRLEEGTFRFPALPPDTDAARQGIEIEAGDLALLLEGVELGSVKRQERYRRPAAASV